MPLSRSQTSQQLVFLLQGQTSLFTQATSVFEGSLLVENYLASGLTFPIAAVLTGESTEDRDDPGGRNEMARFVVSLAAGKVTEALKANYLASGGSSSSQRGVENVVRDLLKGLAYQVGLEGTFQAAIHGFQGRVARISRERLVPAQGTTFDVCDLELEVFDCARGDYFAAPYGCKAAAGAGHSINLTWSNPATRYDQYQNVLRRGTNPGDAAPTTVLGGTGIVITGGVLGVSATDAGPSGSGQVFNYALFRTYNTGTNVSPRVLASATTN